MAARKTAEIRSEPKISEVAEKTRVLIRGLQSRLSAEAPAEFHERGEDTQDDLEKQLQRYFESAGVGPQQSGSAESSVLSDIRTRVIDGVVERILREWDRPQGETSGALENEVINRLIERVLHRLRTASG